MQNLFESVYKGKKVLVTGHTGFKGSWLTLWLLGLGAEVAGYSLEPNTDPSLFNILDLKNNIKHITGDIRDKDTLKEAFISFKPEFVFHLAAQPLVRTSYKDPILTYETNIIGTANVLESTRNIETVKSFVNVTSDKCYENKEWPYGYREIDPMGGYDPYSSSKGCSELITSAYRNSFFNPKDYGKTHNVSLASTRAGNVIGGGDWAEDRLIPDCIRSLSKNQTIEIRNPHSTRPWQHVLEPLSGYLLLGSKLYKDVKYSEGWNFGPYDEDVLTVDDVVKQTLKHWGSGKYNANQKSSLHEANLLKLDISKAISYLDWKPVYKANEAIENTIKWYKTYYSDNTNMLEYTQNQLKDYVNAAKMLSLDWSKE